MVCEKHPKYPAKRPPSSKCPECWAIWNDKQPLVIPTLTDEALRELALDIVNERVFTTAHCQSEGEVTMCFPVLAFLGEGQRKSLQETPPGLVWESYTKAAPRGVNGLPMFFSCHFLTQADRVKLDGMVKELYESQKSFLAGS